jgi:hypothetical protein
MRAAPVTKKNSKPVLRRRRDVAIRAERDHEDVRVIDALVRRDALRADTNGELVRRCRPL